MSVVSTFVSEEALEVALNALDIHPLTRVFGKGNYFVMESDGWDPDAEEIFNRMPEQLTVAEMESINDFVLAEKVAGNFGDYSEIQCYGLEGPNGLTGWLGVGTAELEANTIRTVNSIETTLDEGGILTNMILSQLPNYAQNNNSVCIVATDLNIDGSTAFLFSSDLADTQNNDMRTVFNSQEIRWRSVVSSNLNQILSISLPFPLSVFVMERTASAFATLYRDGVSVDTTNTQNSNAIPPGDVFTIGKRPRSTDTRGRYDVKFFSAGGVFSNPVAQNTNVRALLTDLGAI